MYNMEEDFFTLFYSIFISSLHSLYITCCDEITQWQKSLLRKKKELSFVISSSLTFMCILYYTLFCHNFFYIYFLILCWFSATKELYERNNKINSFFFLSFDGRLHSLFHMFLCHFSSSSYSGISLILSLFKRFLFDKLSFVAHLFFLGFYIFFLLFLNILSGTCHIVFIRYFMQN